MQDPIVPLAGRARASSAARRRAVALVALALFASGCADSAAPDGPPGPDLSNARLAMIALEEFYSKREAEDAIALLTTDYTFHPALPDSIPFLGPGETSWDYTVETDILNLLLVEERASWIDQVLLEITTEALSTSADEMIVTVEADVQLEVLISGVNTLEQSRSKMVLTYERNANGDYLLAGEVESVAINPDTGLPYRELTVGELRAQVLEDRGP